MKAMRWSTLTLVILAAACDRGAAGPLVARTAGHDFTVSQATGLIASQPQLPPQPEVVAALSDLWIDYTLLAEAASKDTTLANVNLDPVIAQQEEGELIVALRDSVVHPDTAIADEAVRARFSAEAPGVRVRARHILISPPEGATPAQSDSTRKVAEGSVARHPAGALCAARARQFSADPGSAAQGGDLGFFDRGAMVASFDSAAFSLEPGQLSDLVPSPYGFHIIRVDEKQAPSFDSLGAQFRQAMQEEVMIKAESTYVSDIMTKGKLEVQEGAATLVREIAKNPLAKLGFRGAGRELAKYDGGALTVGEMRAFMQSREPQYRAQVQQATDQQIIDNLVKALAQRELLVAEAKRSGIQPNTARTDSLKTQLRTSFVDAARQLGLLGIKPNEGETQKAAIDRTVGQVLQEIVLGQREVIPLGPVSFTLRQDADAEMFDDGVQQVVAQVISARGGSTNPALMPPQMPGGPDAGGGAGAPPAGAPPAEAPPAK
jgi:hypothetical protein